MNSKRKASAATEALRTTEQTINSEYCTKSSCHNQDFCTGSLCLNDLALELIMLDAMEDYDRQIVERCSAEGVCYV